MGRGEEEMEENRNTGESVNETPNVGGASGNTTSNSTSTLADKGNDIVAKLGKNAQIWKWVCLGASIIMALSAVLPYASAFGVNVTLLESGSGPVFILLAIVSVVFIFWKHQPIVILVCGVVSFIWNLREMLSLTGDDFVSSIVQKEIGYWLMFLSTLVLVVAGAINFIVNRQQDGGNAAG